LEQGKLNQLVKEGWMNARVCSGPVVLLYCLWLCCLQGVAQEGGHTHLSAEVIAAALRAEDAKGAMWIKAKEEWDEDGKKETSSVVYLRSPKFLMAEEMTTSGRAVRGALTVYDRGSGRWERILWSEKNGRRSADSREVGTDLCQPFIQGEFPETVYAPVSVYTADQKTGFLGLVDLIGTGKVVVHERRETVDGVSCVVVEGKRQQGFADDWKAYLDPEMNFCPRRIEAVREKGETSRMITTFFEKYTRLTNGMWFPKRIRYVREVSEGGKAKRSETLFSVEEIYPGIPVRSPFGDLPLTMSPDTLTVHCAPGVKTVSGFLGR